jgi:HlyD family secretion protein
MKELTGSVSPIGEPSAVYRNGRPRVPKPWYAIAVAVLVLLVLAIGYVVRPRPAPPIATATVVRETLVAAVTATGTVNPQDTISVGTQVSGTIQTIVADYNDRVRQGEVLARPNSIDALRFE